MSLTNSFLCSKTYFTKNLHIQNKQPSMSSMTTTPGAETLPNFIKRRHPKNKKKGEKKKQRGK
jgi:hypothetical protein